MRNDEESSGSLAQAGAWPAALAFVLVAGLLLAAVTANARRSTQRVVAADRRSTSAYARITQLTTVLDVATDAETCSRGFVITGDVGFLAPYDRARARASEEMRDLEFLYARDSVPEPLLRRVRDALAAQDEYMVRIMALRRALGAEEAERLISTFRGRELTDSVRAAINVLVVAEQSALARQRNELESATSAATRKLLVSAALGVLLLLLAFAALIRENLRRRAAEKLMRLETRFHVALDGLLEGCAMVDNDLRCLYVNAVFAKQGRTTVDALVGRSLVETYPGLEGSALVAAIRQTIELNVTSRFEGAFGIADEESGWFDVYLQPVPEGVFILSIERTGHLQSERARAAVEGRVPALRGMLRRERVEVRVTIRNVLGMLQRLMPAHITLEAGPLESDEAACIDQGALEQVIANLCTNARDAMPDGGSIRIDCRSAWLDAGYHTSHPWVQPGQYVCVSVTDSGAGMDDKTRERIFEPFFTTKPTGLGTGLGMSMVYGMMKDHDGMVRVYSELGKGTVVQLYFPVAVGTPVETTSQVPHHQSVVGGAECVLIVEDEPAIRQASRRALESKGYEVLDAADGELALALWRQNRSRVALVISDLVMPNLGGVQLAEALRAEGSDVPVIFTSGYSQDSVYRTGELPPDAQFLHKPWTLVQLFTGVRESLDARRAAS